MSIQSVVVYGRGRDLVLVSAFSCSPVWQLHRVRMQFGARVFVSSWTFLGLFILLVLHNRIYLEIVVGLFQFLIVKEKKIFINENSLTKKSKKKNNHTSFTDL